MKYNIPKQVFNAESEKSVKLFLKNLAKWINENIMKNKSIEQFVQYNKKHADSMTPKLNKSKSIALIECNHAFTTYLLYSIICGIKHKSKIRIIAYRPMQYRNLKDSISFYLFSKLQIDNGLNRPFRILRSMGVSKFIQPTFLKKYNGLALRIYERILQGDKNMLLNLEINEIRIGDLFYDWHLRERLLATIDIKSAVFKEDFLHFMRNYYWWIDYLESNKIESIFVSHSSSNLALPARIGIKFGAKVYLASYGRMYKLTPNKIFSDLEFLDYEPGNLKQFGYKIDLERSRNELTKSKTGEKIVEAHTWGSGYLGNSIEKVIKNSNSINVLIASHCFSDPPHPYGDTLFPDTGEWLDFIGRLSKETNYEFYAKPQPNFWESDKLHFKNYLGKFPNINEVPPNYSNIELFRQGVKVVLTVHGTIAYEAANEGILVVNASLFSPHMNYNFSLSPKSIQEYRDVIMNLPNLLKNWRINLNEIDHFFDLHHIRRSQSTIFGNKISSFYDFIGGYMQQFLNPKVFDYFLNELKNHERFSLDRIVENFLSNEEYMLTHDWY